MKNINPLVNVKKVIRPFIFGMEDGLVSNLGLVLGVYIGGGNTFTIVLAGLASMFAGAFSMSAGSYLSAKSQREVYEHEIASTEKDLEENPQKCLSQMKIILKQEGLNKREIDTLYRKYSDEKHPKFVCNYLVQKKVGIVRENLDLPLKDGLMMFLSFLVGSSFPIAPFIFLTPKTAAILAVSLTIMALFLVGWVKSIYTKLNWFKSGLEIVFIGIGAGVMGYIVGLILRMFA